VTRRRGRGDEGSVLVLGLGLVLLALLAVGVVVDASRLFLSRCALESLADGAALHASHDLDLAALYAHGTAGGLPLSVDRVRADVTRYVGVTARADGLRDVQVLDVRVDAGVVTLTLRVTEPVPLLGAVIGRPDGEVTASASARSAIEP
jgi:hypothetical protein